MAFAKKKKPAGDAVAGDPVDDMVDEAVLAEMAEGGPSNAKPEPAKSLEPEMLAEVGEDLAAFLKGAGEVPEPPQASDPSKLDAEQEARLASVTEMPDDQVVLRSVQEQVSSIPEADAPKPNDIAGVAPGLNAEQMQQLASMVADLMAAKQAAPAAVAEDLPPADEPKVAARELPPVVNAEKPAAKPHIVFEDVDPAKPAAEPYMVWKDIVQPVAGATEMSMGELSPEEVAKNEEVAALAAKYNAAPRKKVDGRLKKFVQGMVANFTFSGRKDGKARSPMMRWMKAAGLVAAGAVAHHVFTMHGGPELLNQSMEAMTIGYQQSVAAASQGAEVAAQGFETASAWASDKVEAGKGMLTSAWETIKANGDLAAGIAGGYIGARITQRPKVVEPGNTLPQPEPQHEMQAGPAPA